MLHIEEGLVMNNEEIRIGDVAVSFSCRQDDDGKWVQSQTWGTIHRPEVPRTENLLAPTRLIDQRFDSRAECMAALKAAATSWAQSKA